MLGRDTKRLTREEAAEDLRRRGLEDEIRALTQRLGVRMDRDIQQLLAQRSGSAQPSWSTAAMRAMGSPQVRRRPPSVSPSPARSPGGGVSLKTLAIKKEQLTERLRTLEQDVRGDEEASDAVAHLEAQAVSQGRMIDALRQELAEEKHVRSLLQSECEGLRAEVGVVREYERTLASLIDDNGRMQQQLENSLIPRQQAHPTPAPQAAQPAAASDARRQRMLADLSRRLASQAAHAEAVQNSICSALTELRVLVALEPSDWGETASHLGTVEALLEEAESRCLAAHSVVGTRRGGRQAAAPPSPSPPPPLRAAFDTIATAATTPPRSTSGVEDALQAKHAQHDAVLRRIDQLGGERATLQRRLAEVRRKRQDAEGMMLAAAGASEAARMEVAGRIRDLAEKAGGCEAGIQASALRMHQKQAELEAEAAAIATSIKQLTRQLPLHG